MASFQCPRCGMNRSKRRHSLCTICSFRDDLVGEHEQGAHDQRVNPSCDICKPKHNEWLSKTTSRYVKSVLDAEPLTKPYAKLLLQLDRHGFSAAARLGPKGSRAMLKLKRQGHLDIEFFKGVPYVWVSAHSRRDALDMLALSVDSSSRRESPRDAVSAPKRAAATSHAQCTHERTPKARAKCRAERAASH